jgi:hypothetical protein
MSTIMHGPALDGSGETHQTMVHPDNILAFKRAGWVEGEIVTAEPVEESGDSVVESAIYVPARPTKGRPRK